MERDLRDLRARVLRLGGRAEDMVVRATRAMVQRDRRLAEQTIALEPEVEALARRIDRDCLQLMDRWRPGGDSLRSATFILQVVPHLERIAALAAGISARARDLADDGVADPGVEIGDMGTVVSEMLADAIDAFVHADPASAQAVIDRDDALDERYHQLRRARMQAAQDARGPAELRRAIHTLTVAKHLERMGDHATSIAERVLQLAASSGGAVRRVAGLG
jgi:phosphate transport system protein